LPIIPRRQLLTGASTGFGAMALKSEFVKKA
jgi:uncharacterized Zn ribbon protein